MNFSYPGRKNNDSVLEIFFLRSKHSERGTTSLARIASIINEETEKRQRTETFSKLFGYCKCFDMTG